MEVILGIVPDFCFFVLSGEVPDLATEPVNKRLKLDFNLLNTGDTVVPELIMDNLQNAVSTTELHHSLHDSVVTSGMEHSLHNAALASESQHDFNNVVSTSEMQNNDLHNTVTDSGLGHCSTTAAQETHQQTSQLVGKFKGHF